MKPIDRLRALRARGPKVFDLTCAVLVGFITAAVVMGTRG